MENKANKVMIFGVFDGLHDGHRFFIENSQEYGKKLVIVVTPDETVKFLKNKVPKNTLFNRVSALEKEYPNAQVLIGDKRIEKWTILEDNKPDLVVCGYDQNALYNALRDQGNKYQFKTIQIKKSVRKNELHSSLLNK